MRVEVVRKGSDPRFKYHMFKRLNTGGIILTAQQLRNCTIRLLDPTFNNFIIELSKVNVFQECIASLNKERILEAYDQELVLRFFTLKNYRNHFKRDVRDFLTEYMEAVSDPDPRIHLPFDYEAEKAIFNKTFLILKTTLGEYAFASANRTRDKLIRRFAIYHFEAFTIGLQSSIERINPENEEMMKRLDALFKEIKYDEEFIKMTTGVGNNSRGPLRERIGFVSGKIEKEV